MHEVVKISKKKKKKNREKRERATAEESRVREATESSDANGEREGFGRVKIWVYTSQIQPSKTFRFKF